MRGSESAFATVYAHPTRPYSAECNVHFFLSIHATAGLSATPFRCDTHMFLQAVTAKIWQAA
jgi:hypothetical protein